VNTWRYAFAGLLFSTQVLSAADDWQLYRFEGRDYVSIDNIAKFYGFAGEVAPASQIPPASPLEPLAKKVLLDKGDAQLAVTTNSREVFVNGVKHWLGFPVRVEGEKILLSRLDLAKTVEPMLRPELIGGLAPVTTVVLDPGHGGHDKGAVSVFGMEKNFALDVCMRAKKLLQDKGLKVVMTRETDVFIPLEQRPKVANRIPNSIFVAVHFNDSLANRAANGFEIFSCTPRGEPSTDESTLSARNLRNEPGNIADVSSAALSASIYHSVLGQVPRFDRGMKKARFAVLRLATVPAILMEGGFVSNADEVRAISTPAFRQQLAESLVTGIANYKQLAEHKQRPRVLAEYRQAPAGGLTLREAPTVVTNTQPSGEAPKSN
jgi:N-acetylmuramoyl-L-alanine amidase